MDARKDVKAKKSGMKRQKPVGVLSVCSPKDFDIDDIERRLETNEQEINEKQAEIEGGKAARLAHRLRVRDARRGDRRYECINAVKDSIANETTRRKEGGQGLGSALAADDTRNFAGAHRLDILLTAAPSDVLWENLDFPRETLWKRRLLMNVLMIVFLFLQMAVAIARSRFVIQTSPTQSPTAIPSARVASTKAPKIWDLDSKLRHQRSGARGHHALCLHRR